MSEAKRIAVAALAAMDAQAYDELDRLFAQDLVVVWAGTTLTGRAAFYSALSQSYVPFPDQRHEVLAAVCTPERAALQLKITATHLGPFQSPFGEFAATGKPVSWNAATFVTVESGRAVRWEAYMDLLQIHQLVGADLRGANG